jgi:hypothetical protein
MKKAKTFDCVEHQHRAGAMILEKLKDMTREEQMEFWRQRSEELRQRQEVLRAQRKSPATVASGE